MLRFVIIALVTCELVLLSAFALSPASAASNELAKYSWGFTSVGSSQVVCKQIVFHPEKELKSKNSDRKVIQMFSSSNVVSDHFCANLAKPIK